MHTVSPVPTASASEASKMALLPPTTSQKVFIKTFGCQMNEYDSEKMLHVLETTLGYQKTLELTEASLILLNTCSIREKAEQKLFSDLGRIRDHKKQNPHVIIGVGGCVASQEGKAILSRAPYVDLVFGPQTLHRLPHLINHVKTQHRPIVDISFPEIEKFDNLPKPRAEGPSAFISIMEGCSKYCSYCVVPYTRGEEISRPFDDVIAEVASLAQQGVREVTLLGQNVNDYQGKMFDEEIADLAVLIKYTAAIPAIERIRFTTSHPLAFSSNLIQAFAEIPKLCNHLHLPVQSGSDRILNLMKRGYTTLEFKSKMRQLKKIRPTISISSDFIVGFPGETDEDFEKTMKLVREIGFDHSFSFIYSPRPGTPAASIVDDVPLSVKKTRLEALQTLLRNQGQTISENMLGQTEKILITGVSKKNSQELTGRTENNRIVNFLAPQTLIGQMVNVLITDVLTNSLRGRLVYTQNE